MNQAHIVMLVMTILGSGLMAGLFCSFSNFIMRSLAQISPASGICAMQSINIVIVRPVFLLVFFGTGMLSVVAMALGWQLLNSLALTLGCLGSGIYILGCLGVTMAFNVPLNNRLAVVLPDSKEGQVMWDLYLVKWVFWNHVRSLATILSTLCFAMALYYAG